MEIELRIHYDLCPQIEHLIRRMLDKREDCTVTYYSVDSDKLIIQINP